MFRFHVKPVGGKQLRQVRGWLGYQTVSAPRVAMATGV
jgi:hypothetical protein